MTLEIDIEDEIEETKSEIERDKREKRGGR